MSLSVAGKYAVITGAGSGINLAFARLLLENDCSVMIGDLALRPEAQQLLTHYPHSQQPNGNNTNTNRPSALFQKKKKKKTSFWHPPKTPSNPDSESRDAADAEPGTYAVLDVNLTHPTRLSQLAIGYWTQEGRSGCLVHVSSIAGHAAGIGSPLYVASKHGLHRFVRCMAGMRDRLGIRCSDIADPNVAGGPGEEAHDAGRGRRAVP
ncbi:hypothetical protein BDP55DRAFT_641675 [Colletotrichum godetiae]|uniref:Uncharacterized protein n=1 Tax=Colletotrichum godetiae TaxID=1209918 RepID=A0AAJ0B0Z8_9PEZI|nr:uncharacterized protein BDP55DRAFT_641675 [Colletotrichum godetiae]KAK1701458.1 hypothetical protein BDP55DRAFT_641675 [Colletotrichum godetiae]